MELPTQIVRSSQCTECTDCVQNVQTVYSFFFYVLAKREVTLQLLPNTLVSGVFCGFAHHVGKR